MRIFRALVTAAVPIGIATVALLNARAMSALVEATVSANMELPVTASAATNAALARMNAEEAARTHEKRPTADAVLDRNPFDHLVGSLRPGIPTPDAPPRDLDTDPRTAPLCEGVRPLVLVGDEDQRVAFASFEVDGKRVLRRRGGDVGDKRVAYVGRDRVWLEGRTGLCQALLFGAPPPRKDGAGASERVTADPRPGGQSQLELDVGKQISKVGPNDYVIERSAVDRILEAQAELMKQRIVQEKEGDRVVGVRVFGIKSGSVLSMLGIENGDRLETLNGFEMSNPEKMLEAYARLRSGADKLQIHLTRNGKPTNVDYTIR
jgi:general secretion pathway protein C